MGIVCCVADWFKETTMGSLRHQRRVNRTTYLRLVEIYAEMQMLQREGASQDNAMQHRTAIFERYAKTVSKFEGYLHKYSDMHRVVRIFKTNKMEKKRQEIVDEVDHLFRMFRFATSAAEIKEAYATDKNAAKFLAKLKKMHKDVTLTHDQVQAALLKLVEKHAAESQKLKLAEQQHQSEDTDVIRACGGIPQSLLMPVKAQ